MPDVKEVLDSLAKANSKLIQLVHLTVLRSLSCWVNWRVGRNTITFG
jgi:hypothetical protein